MSDVCAIVTIKTKNGPVDINAADHDEEKHGKALTPAQIAKLRPAPEDEPEAATEE